MLLPSYIDLNQNKVLDVREHCNKHYSGTTKLQGSLTSRTLF